MTNRSEATLIVALLALAIPALAQQDDDPVDAMDSKTERMPVNTIVPEYPEAARRERIEGEVQVCFDITRSGMPRRIAVRRSSHRYFEKPARDAVRRSTWRAVPPGEKAPNIKACRTFRFRLERIPLDERD
ncbi:MAG: energy transducer TonB [Gammaproteobacteria bacterium]|nr:energy transducer TonB [Gammaproteobacteria bacterium]NNF49363.1 energy transducer TonB [Woeseiaceae bacterium]MBT8093564.1 energy transducer TonB [Gammaproteobacteria bacterium]MBT8106472.1 energy transducer TonB [Gammaproteobacteria bacterium]NNK26487.1 energy transducer TonB [Woeseiaceae bacterium]